MTINDKSGKNNLDASGSELGKTSAYGFQGHPLFPGGYPKDFADESHPGYITYPQQPVTPELHFRSDFQLPPGETKQVSDNFHSQYVSFSKEADDRQHLVTDKADHFIRDYNDPSLKGKERPASNNNKVFSRPAYGSKNPYAGKYANEYTYDKMFDESAEERSLTYTQDGSDERPVFSGSTTPVNPFPGTDTYKEDVLAFDLEAAERRFVHAANRHKWSQYRDQSKGDTYYQNHIPRQVPLSPLHPFTRLDVSYTGPSSIPIKTKQMMFQTYNRTHLPVADAEFRKGFRHTFFSRPECYLMYSNNGKPMLCEQAEHDEDFLSLYMRAPHIVNLLSPSYVTGTHGISSVGGTGISFQDNWNYLLSNRVLGVSVNEETLTQKETMAKTAEGYTVIPGLHVESRTGSTISISFKETKDLEVSDFIRGWMMYIHKRARGYFYPPYNGYQYENTFFPTNRQVVNIAKSGLRDQLHPYDRALEYCASMFDFVTNESDSRILYWCKYYGIYPVSLSSPVSYENNGPLTNENMKIDVTFRYQYKLPCVNKSLVEFNYNSGICDSLGRPTIGGKPEFSNSFLKKENGEGYSNVEGKDPNYAIVNYIGAAGMFTGTPMVLMQTGYKNPLSRTGDDQDMTMVPVLRFANMADDEYLNELLNLGFNQRVQLTSERAAYASY